MNSSPIVFTWEQKPFLTKVSIQDPIDKERGFGYTVAEEILEGVLENVDEENHTRVQGVSANVNQVDNEEDIADQYTVEPSTPLAPETRSSTDAVDQQNIFNDGEFFHSDCNCNFRSEHCITVMSHLKLVHKEMAVLGDKECMVCGVRNRSVFKELHICQKRHTTRKGY